VRELAGGAFSPFATRDLKEGETLHVMVPSGSFGPQVHESGPRQYGMVAAGSGITPILSIAASVLEGEPLSRVSLLYGNRTASSTMFRKELTALRDRHGDRLDVTHVLSRERDGQAIHGRIRPELLDVVFPIDEISDWFLCGPEGLMEETAAALAQRGVAPDRVHRELFHSDATVEIDHARRPELTSQVRLRLNGVESVMPLHSRGESILTAALEIRDDLPYACREAICGTCRAKLVAGEVVMDRCSALDRRELDAGYVLACQAHPVTPAVTLDFDT
jgi:ring-1,2-phenylacetyl-CoA epoxidase subunit PaaE